VRQLQFPAAVPNNLGKISGTPVHSVSRKFLYFLHYIYIIFRDTFNIRFNYVIIILACNYILIIYSKPDI
jgi:hypothetical protein